jgi:ATP-dependent Clp protease protease subunit
VRRSRCWPSRKSAAGPHVIFRLGDPLPVDDAVADLPAHARQHVHQLQRLHELVAAACRRPIDAVTRDMRDGRLLDAEQARGYNAEDLGQPVT